MAQRYEISFTDKKGRDLRVGIFSSGWTGGVTRLTGGEAPLILQEDDSDGIDTPLRAWTGNLTVADVDAADLSGLFADDVASARVEVTDATTQELLWQGFIAPEVLRQPWVSGEEVTVNVQSPLGALSGLTLDQEGGFGFTTLGALLAEVNALAGGAWDYVAYPDDISLTAGGDTSAWLDLQVSRYAFFETSTEEEEVTPDVSADVRVYTGATGSEVVEAVARLMGWTASERGRTLWFTAESSPGYRRVRAAQLSQPGRSTEALEDAQTALYSLTPAGTDHTDSLLQGYRRVTVSFTPEVEDNLLSGLTPENWTPTGEVAFQEDSLCVWTEPDGTDVDAGFYVVLGRLVEGSVAVQYRFARYAGQSRDGHSSAHLYTARSPVAVVSWTITAGTDMDRLTWADVEGETRQVIKSWLGGEAVWLRWRLGHVAWRDTTTGWRLLEQNGASRKFAVLVWPAADKNAPIDNSGRKMFTGGSTCPMFISGGALKLSIKFSGFICANYTIFSPTGLKSPTKMGPWTATKWDAVRQWTLSLRLGGWWWNGTGWQTEECTFTVELEGDQENDHAEIKGTGREDDPDLYIDGDEGYILPLRGADGEPLNIMGDAQLTIYGPTGNVATDGHAYFNPFMLYDITLESLRETDSSSPYRDDGDDGGTHRYSTNTGYRTANDEKEVELAVGTRNGDPVAYNILITPGGEPLSTLVSKRQGGRAARPERLVLSLLKRLYGRARRQLCVEVDAARLSPSATVTDGQTRYALSGVEWDVRESTCKYTLEDYVPFDEWKG